MRLRRFVSVRLDVTIGVQKTAVVAGGRTTQLKAGSNGRKPRTTEISQPHQSNGYTSITPMMVVFLTALVIGVGAVAVQLFGGHDAGHDTGGHDTDGHDGPLMLLASIRFWAFTFLAFGLVGTLLTLFRFAGPLTSTILATVTGLASGYVSAMVVRRLQGQGTSSSATSRDVIGLVGRVIVPPSTETRGKVRVSVRGSVVDYVARSNEPLEADEAVVVEECGEEGEVLVSRAPKELRP